MYNKVWEPVYNLIFVTDDKIRFKYNINKVVELIKRYHATINYIQIY